MAATHTTQDISSHDATSMAGSFLQVCEVAGIRVNIGHIDDYLRLVSRCIREGKHVNILNHNMHSLYHYFKNEQLRKIYEKSVVMVDGWWVLAILRAHGYPVNSINRMAWIDFIWPLLSFAERHGFRVFWLGNSAEVNQQGLRRIREQLPSLMISGSSRSLRPVIREQRQPRDRRSHQRLSHRHLHRRHGNAASGTLDRSPRTDGMRPRDVLRRRLPRIHLRPCRDATALARAARLEWAYRFFSNPRRFAFRYLVEPWRVLFEILKHDFAGTSNRLLGFGGQPSPEQGYYEPRRGRSEKEVSG